MPLTTIQGSLATPFGLDAITGAIHVAAPAFTDADGVFHPAGYQIIDIVNSAYSFQLAPNEGQAPTNTYYTATYYLGPGQLPASEYWVVPEIPDGATISIDQIRQRKSIPAPPFAIPITQLYSATANIGDALIFNGLNYVPVTIQTVHPFEFTDQTSIAILGGAHGQGTALVTAIYDSDGNEFDAQLTVDPFSGDVTYTWIDSASGFGFIYGGLGRSLPNASKVFFNQSVCVVPQKYHRFSTHNLMVQVYDPDGNKLDTYTNINVSAGFDVTVTFASPASCRVVVCGCLGIDSDTPSGGSPGSGSSTPTPPYDQAVTSQSTVTISASTHGKGAKAHAAAFTTDTPSQAVALNYSRDGSGNIICTFDPPFTGTIEVF